MGKGLKIFGVILLLVVVAMGFAYYSITSSKTVAAQLSVEKGSVTVNGNSVAGNIKLKQTDVVETGADGKASVVLYESIFVLMESNTKIIISDLTKEHPQIKQESGETWNKFTKLLGIEEYSVQAGNSVASVRGTAFGITPDKIFVGEGNVEYARDGKKYDVPKDRAVENKDGKILERTLSGDEKAKVEAQDSRTIEELKDLRESEIEKHPTVVGIVKSQYGLTDEQIAQGLSDADDGKINLEELSQKSPMQIDSVDKIVQITKEIQKLKAIGV